VEGTAVFPPGQALLTLFAFDSLLDVLLKLRCLREEEAGSLAAAVLLRRQRTGMSPSNRRAALVAALLSGNEDGACVGEGPPAPGAVAAVVVVTFNRCDGEGRGGLCLSLVCRRMCVWQFFSCSGGCGRIGTGAGGTVCTCSHRLAVFKCWRFFCTLPLVPLPPARLLCPTLVLLAGPNTWNACWTACLRHTAATPVTGTRRPHISRLPPLPRPLPPRPPVPSAALACSAQSCRPVPR
jgi:hypothetical protein